MNWKTSQRPSTSRRDRHDVGSVVTSSRPWWIRASEIYCDPLPDGTYAVDQTLFVTAGPTRCLEGHVLQIKRHECIDAQRRMLGERTDEPINHEPTNSIPRSLTATKCCSLEVMQAVEGESSTNVVGRGLDE